jgi:hypothetical protein
MEADTNANLQKQIDDNALIDATECDAIQNHIPVKNRIACNSDTNYKSNTISYQYILHTTECIRNDTIPNPCGCDRSVPLHPVWFQA